MIRQIITFGFVGTTALIVHWLTVALLVPQGMAPLSANVVGFLIAFQISYWGHRHFTFQKKHVPWTETLPRFFIVAVLSFLVNEAMYYMLLTYTQLNYRLSLFLVLALVAILTFVMSRQWAFAR
jgi:putative flippase GtrA